jgi:hypothetical protein
VPQEHDIVEILEFDEIHNVGDVGFEVYFGVCEVHPFAQTGEGDEIGIVPLLSEPTGDCLPTPAPKPTTTDQDVDAHPKDLLVRQQPKSGSSHLVSAYGRGAAGDVPYASS